jgi:hypothetical protein
MRTLLKRRVCNGHSLARTENLAIAGMVPPASHPERLLGWLVAAARACLHGGLAVFPGGQLPLQFDALAICPSEVQLSTTRLGVPDFWPKKMPRRRMLLAVHPGERESPVRTGMV